MSTSSNISLGALRLQAQQRISMENNPAIADSEWNTYLTASVKELYDLLIGAYGNDYYVANTYRFTTTGAQSYALPDGSPSFQDSTGVQAQKFYKLLGVDLQYSASPTGWVSLKRFEMIERNKFAWPNMATTINGYTNLRYRISGNNLYFVPLPQTGQTIQVWYAPAPTSLQVILPTVTASGGTIGSISDTTGLSIGMSVYNPQITSGTTVLGLSSTSVTFSNPINVTSLALPVAFWSDATSIDGISGWEEYPIIDACIKAQIKQENDITGLVGQKAEMKARLEAMAEGRDAGQAHHVSDVVGANGDAYTFDGMGFGYDGGGGY